MSGVDIVFLLQVLEEKKNRFFFKHSTKELCKILFSSDKNIFSTNENSKAVVVKGEWKTGETFCSVGGIIPSDAERIVDSYKKNRGKLFDKLESRSILRGSVELLEIHLDNYTARVLKVKNKIIHETATIHQNSKIFLLLRPPPQPSSQSDEGLTYTIKICPLDRTQSQDATMFKFSFGKNHLEDESQERMEIFLRGLHAVHKYFVSKSQQGIEWVKSFEFLDTGAIVDYDPTCIYALLHGENGRSALVLYVLNMSAKSITPGNGRGTATSTRTRTFLEEAMMRAAIDRKNNANL